MPPETIPALAPALAQFGAAGLIGWMWLTERRASAAREKQLAELHDRLMQERTHLGTLLSVLSDNTRALTALELGQRGVVSLLQKVSEALARSDRMRSCEGESEARA